ncbi:SDR family oxidoreductase [Enterobacter asburiae]|uniref:SDR family oxidoreductase n=1 Tax=Enterobacter TaxID=547 RepID=UPI0020758DA1|nr:SDR family oxidoreductase [Enterobacter bugandensis]MCM7470875.1 SDR family oxidoreductase [Enterobacter bugandensis]
MKKILVTGATGFLGGAVVAELMKSNNMDSLLLLARGDEKSSAIQRVKDNLLKFGIDEIQLSRITAQQILEGDLSCPEKFLSDLRLEQVEKVVNCAAIASFGNNPLIWKVNVEGTFELASRMSKVKGLKRFVHIGTAMSCIPTPNSNVIEGMNPTQRKDHFVEYTWSKSTIEQMIINKLSGFPLVIARPSIVVGHTEHGCKPSASIFWVFRMALKLGKFMCNLEDRIDVIPVDYCAKAIIKLLKAPVLEYPVYHISSGKKSSVTFAEIDQAMACASNAKPVSYNYQKVGYKELSQEKHKFSSLFGDCNEKIILKSMALYGEFSKLNVTFDNEKILELGMPVCPRFTDYIGKCHDSVKDKMLSELMAVDFK